LLCIYLSDIFEGYPDKTVDQRRSLFYTTLKHHSSILTRVIAKLCQRDTLSVAAKYGSKCSNVSIMSVKLSVWEICNHCIDFYSVFTQFIEL